MKSYYLILVFSFFFMNLISGQSVKEWEAVKSKNSIKAYEDFIDKFPDGKYAMLAGQEILQLIKSGKDKDQSDAPTKSTVTKQSTIKKPELRYFSSQKPVWSKSLQGFISPMLVPVEKEMLINLNNPDIQNIELVKDLNIDTSYIFHSDIQIISISEEKVIVVKGTVGFLLPMFGGKMKSLVGLPNSRIEISLLKSGFSYVGKIWYPMTDSNCFIYCLEDKIIGVNVKTK